MGLSNRRIATKGTGTWASISRIISLTDIPKRPSVESGATRAGRPSFIETIYDYVIIGSGFGGSVSAWRLIEKGYSVLVIERGKRWEGGDFPKTNWNVFKYLWMPALRCFGPQGLNFFKDIWL